MSKSLAGLKQSGGVVGDRKHRSAKSHDSHAPIRSIEASFQPRNRFVVPDGTLEALKWAALALMLLDHINKFFFDEGLPGLFPVGRIVMPIFGFVLVYNLARPDALARGVHARMIRRLALTGLLATPVVFALNGTVVSQYAWWPLNVLFTLLIVVLIIYVVDRGGRWRFVTAATLFILAGAFIEYLWMGVLACLGAWAYCRAATPSRLIVWCVGVFSLTLVNANAWALAAIPIVLIASKFNLRVPRSKWVFYVFYPAHLFALLVIKEMLMT